jgi:hypothetical protein
MIGNPVEITRILLNLKESFRKIDSEIKRLSSEDITLATNFRDGLTAIANHLSEVDRHLGILDERTKNLNEKIDIKTERQGADPTTIVVDHERRITLLEQTLEQLKFFLIQYQKQVLPAAQPVLENPERKRDERRTDTGQC